MYYLIITGSAILIAVSFVFQKFFQRAAGADIRSALFFNAFCGLVTAVAFLPMNGFRLHLSLFSIALALLAATLCLLYTVLGFKIMKAGNVSDYSVYLMTGGMLVPYIWGIVFLDEKLSPLHILGLIILFAVIASGKEKGNTKLSVFIMCIGVFLLNGGISVVSKLHQIDTVHNAVGANEFTVLTGLAKFAVCSVVIVFYAVKGKMQFRKFCKIRLLGITALFAIISGISYLMQLICAGKIPATVLYPIISGGTIIFTTLAGWMLCGERPDRKVWIKTVACFIGTCLFL